MSFKLAAGFVPEGDQPQAIDKLVAGLESGEPTQVLLGVTGSGKSVAWDEVVLTRTRRDDGQYTTTLGPIGALVDTVFGTEPLALDSEVVEPPTPTEALSFNPRTGATEWRPVSAFTRHTAPEQIYRVRTECGREVVVTGDHNFFSLRDGELRLSATTELTQDDYLPLPPAIELPDRELESLDLVELLADEARIEVHAPEAVEWMVAQVGWPRVRAVLARHYREPSAKRLSIAKGRKWRGVLIPVFRELLAELQLELPCELSVQVRALRTPHRCAGLPRALAISDELLTLLGLMLAEGHCTNTGYAIFSCHDPGVRSEFLRCATALGIRTSVRPNSDVQISSRLWNTALRHLVGARSRDKHLPAFWPQLSKRQLAILLRAYFEGDGGVDGQSVSATTASRRLASELGYALFRFEIWSHLHRRWKHATKARSDGDWYHSLTVSDQRNLSRFATAIGFLTHRKNGALESLLGRAENSNVDVVPISGPSLARLRTDAGLTRAALARHTHLSRAALIHIERGTRRPTRTTLSRLITAIGVLDVAKVENARRLSATRRLLRAHWTRIASIEPVEYAHPFVYDFTVPGNETFLAGHGGLFVHNTFSLANVIARVNRPALIMAHNKTLAAQLYQEFRTFFPENAVEYFVSYYDYYQPEAYIASTDTYIEKEATINEEIDRLRMSATRALFERRDCVIVASVSCIYGLGDPDAYYGMLIFVEKGKRMSRTELLRRLVEVQYSRNDTEFQRGTFRVRGDVVEIYPIYQEQAIRVEFWGDEIDSVSTVDPLLGEVIATHERLPIYPKTHYVMPQDRLKRAVKTIRAELEDWEPKLIDQEKLVEAQRLRQRTMYDLEMLKELGYCRGVENYSRHLTGRAPGQPPPTLLDYLPRDAILVIDESHQTVPQIRGMWAGDRSRKENLVNYGFRLPSAMDNRPLTFAEWEGRPHQLIFVSATPGPYELTRTGGEVVEQLIRPTGLVDPEVDVRPVKGQIDDLLNEIRQRVERGERVLVTTLTKKMSEDLSEYYAEVGVRVRYLHSEIETLERVKILRDLRRGDFDVLVGINLLREGLDLPEVSLVAILDADKEGFLRSDISLIQTIGRAARNVNGTAILYADRITDSMRRAIEETRRRREVQAQFNRDHGIEPRSIVKPIEATLVTAAEADYFKVATEIDVEAYRSSEQLAEAIERLEREMRAAAAGLEFERAAELRDKVKVLRERQLALA